MTTIKIKSSIQEADISKRLRQFQDDLLKLNLIKKGQDPVQELEGDSGNYIITVELEKTPKELLPLLESLGVPYEGTKYFDEAVDLRVLTYVCSEGKQHIEEISIDDFEDREKELTAQGCTEIKVFSAPTEITIKYCTPEGEVSTTKVSSNDAQTKMQELASKGCTKVSITNDEHYTRDNGPRSTIKDEHEFEEMFSVIRTKLEDAPNSIKQDFNNLIEYFSNK